MKNKFKYILLFGALIVFGTGCQDFLDINDDPNNPLEVPVAQILPSTQLSMFRSFGSQPGGAGNMTSLYMHHITQRGDALNDYGFNGQTGGVAGPWGGIYINTLTNIREMTRIATEQEYWPYVGISQILKAYTYSVLVDLYGDVPFDNANQGSLETNPSYQLGEDIYPQLFDLLDSGIINVERASPINPGSDDVIYGGDSDKWVKFANTLKLKLYNQIRLTRDVSAEVNALLSEPELLFESEEDDFELQYGSAASPDSRNPYYASEWGPAANSQYISPYFYEIMTGQNTFHRNDLMLGIVDPRVPYYFYNQLEDDEEAENPTSYRNDDGFLSIYMFSFNIDPNEGFDQSSSVTLPGLYACGGRYDDESVNVSPEGDITGVKANFNGTGDVPMRLLTYADLLYIRAEMALVGVTGEDPQELLNDAIQASFDKVNVLASSAGAPVIAQADIDTYIGSVIPLYTAGDADTQLEVIMTQKWIAGFSNGIDRYTDYRRTGFPELHDGNNDDLAVTVRTRDFPVAFPWSLNDLNLNTNSPAQKNVANATVFWDL
jgi:hypothetical protein